MQCRTIDLPARRVARSIGLYRRHADRRGFCERQSWDRSDDLFLGDFQFHPEIRAAIYAALQAGDRAFTSTALESFFVPYLALRNRRRGYAVSIVKAGLRAVGRPAGPVRAPLIDLTTEEDALLAALIERTKEQ